MKIKVKLSKEEKEARKEARAKEKLLKEAVKEEKKQERLKRKQEKEEKEKAKGLGKRKTSPIVFTPHPPNSPPRARLVQTTLDNSEEDNSEEDNAAQERALKRQKLESMSPAERFDHQQRLRQQQIEFRRQLYESSSSAMVC